MSFNFCEIMSRKNEKIIWASKLSDKKNRDREGVFFVEGFKLLEEALSSQLTADKIFFTSKALERYGSLLEKAGCKECYLVSGEVYEKLSQEDSPQGIFTVFEKPCEKDFSDTELGSGGFIILEDMQNPLNLGAVFRCAYSLGSKRIILSDKCADVYNPKTLRSGMGSIFKSEFRVVDDICGFIRHQKELGNRVFCTHLHSDSAALGSFEFKASDSIVIGNEGHGVSDAVAAFCSGSVIIPMVSGAESLNAATASSVIIWEMNKEKLLNNK